MKPFCACVPVSFLFTGPTVYYDNPATPRPRLAYANACDSMSLLSSVNETPTRRIGFTPQESRVRCRFGKNVISELL